MRIEIRSTKLIRSPCVSSAFATIMRRTCIVLMRIVLRKNYKLVHKLIPMPQAMKIPATIAAVDKEWENWKKFGVELDESQK